MNDKLVLIQSFNNPIDAHIIKGLIESNGIETWLFDENIAYTNPVLTTAVGRIKLMVREEDVDEVLKILQSETIDESEEEKIVCPNCGSSHIFRKSKTNWKAVFIMLVSFVSTPTGGRKNFYDCQHCGHEWD